jgi:hypothetical protein
MANEIFDSPDVIFKRFRKTKRTSIPVKKLFAKKIVWKVGDILNLANFIPSNFRKPIIFGYN